MDRSTEAEIDIRGVVSCLPSADDKQDHRLASGTTDRRSLKSRRVGVSSRDDLSVLRGRHRPRYN